MPLSAGDRVGPYEIVALLGAGGMGEVYRARDSKLNREVAIKILPAALANDAQYMARFEREAQLLAALNHPHIATVYGIERSALVMELVDGPTLADRIAQSPVPVEEALPIARQIAAGLEAAHERGIIHRDLKPANIKLTAEGQVKLLDFGLAKTMEPPPGSSAASPTMSPTLSLAMTQAGMILGTAGYMSPEQARGKPVDKRADIWAFGVVLYEMLTGRPMFQGETVTDTLASVVKDSPRFDALPPETPGHVIRLLDRCLRKDVTTRLRDIGEARVLLDEPPAAAILSQAAPGARARFRPGLWVAAVLASLVVGAAAGVGWYAARPKPLQPLIRLAVDPGPGTDLVTVTSQGNPLAIAPDGSRLAVVMRAHAGGVAQVHIRPLNQTRFTPLPGTENAVAVFFSPDGQWLGFRADGKVKKISVEGGVPVVVGGGETRGFSWGDDGAIVTTASANGALVRIPAAGGKAEPVTKLLPDESSHRWPQVLPGRDLLLFSSTGPNDRSVQIFSQRTAERATVQHSTAFGKYLPSGHFVYLTGNTLFAAPFDLDRRSMTAAPVPVLDDVAAGTGGNGYFDWAHNGTFVYLPGKSADEGWSISWIGPSGNPQPLLPARAHYGTPRISPDGKRLAYSLASSSGEDIWVRDLERNVDSRVTFLEGTNVYPLWTPDSAALIFRSGNAARKQGLYWVRADGAQQPQLLTEGYTLLPFPLSVSSDGRRLAFSAFSAEATLDVFTAVLEGDAAHPRLGKPESFLSTNFMESSPAFSPDGRWIAYTANDTGTAELYVRPFPGPGGKWLLTNGGAQFPRWSSTSPELIYGGPDGRLMAVPYTVKGDSFFAGKPRLWSDTVLQSTGPSPNFDLAPDGKRAVALTRAPGNDVGRSSTQIVVLLNFFDELKRRLGK